MLLAGGIPALILFLWFVISLFITGFIARKRQPEFGDFLIGCATIIAVAALFNSTIKDFGEKHVLLIILATWLSLTDPPDKLRDHVDPLGPSRGA